MKKYIRRQKMSTKKAFTLVELLIVIAIIGILFVVLVSKVDFATDKAKASGVQTDFRSLQMAFEQVSREHVGFNMLGWNTGDVNANGVRDSVDEGDANEDGICQDGETWTGRKKYLETWTDKYSLIRPGTTFAADGYDKDAIFALETAINKNLDPKLHITIDAKTGLITMANGAQDPWNTQYHGAYISAEDGVDRGAIVMYSNGPNQQFGTSVKIANGVVTTAVSLVDADHPDNNKLGQDDYVMSVVYTYTNGFGEIGSATWGFTPNKEFFAGNNGVVNGLGNVSIPEIVDPQEPVQPEVPETPVQPEIPETPVEPEVPEQPMPDIDNPLQDNVDTSTLAPGLYQTGSNYTNMLMSWEEIINPDTGVLSLVDGFLWNKESDYNEVCAATDVLRGDLVLPNDGSVTTLQKGYKTAFGHCYYLTNIVLPDSITSIGYGTFYYCRNLNKIEIPNTVTSVNLGAFSRCYSLSQLVIPENVTSVSGSVAYAFALVEVVNLSELDASLFPKRSSSRNGGMFNYCTSFNDSKLSVEDNFVWFNNDGEMWLVNDWNITPYRVLPNDYHGKTYQIEGMIYFNDEVIETLIMSDNITNMENQVFQDCLNLQHVKLSKNMVKIDNAAFENCPKLKTIVWPEKLTEMNHMVFTECGFEEIVIPETITTWNYGVFAYCSDLRSVTILNGNCTWLNNGTYRYFAECSLDYVDFAENLNMFNKDWFLDVTCVKTLIIRSTTPPPMSGKTELTGLTAIYVPAESVELYKTTAGWASYADIIFAINE